MTSASSADCPRAKPTLAKSMSVAFPLKLKPFRIVLIVVGFAVLQGVSSTPLVSNQLELSVTGAILDFIKM